jgi:hypothetical protein
LAVALEIESGGRAVARTRRTEAARLDRKVS